MCVLARWDDHELRLLEDADAAELHELIEANRAHLAPWLPWAAGQRIEHTSQFIARTRSQLDGNDGFQLAVIATGRIVGVAGFTGVDWHNRTTDIGYWLAEQEQGRGTMTRAVQCLVSHALAEWDLHRVEIRAEPGNMRSRAVAERLGFHEDGTLREAVRVGERYVDHVVYSMLAGEWRGGPPAGGG